MAETSHFEVRFGSVAIWREFITARQLVEATVIQVTEDVGGKPHRLIGEILVEQGYMTPAQVDKVLDEIEDGGKTQNT
jgi:hypothetical protein